MYPFTCNWYPYQSEVSEYVGFEYVAPVPMVPDALPSICSTPVVLANTTSLLPEPTGMYAESRTTSVSS